MLVILFKINRRIIRNSFVIVMHDLQSVYKLALFILSITIFDSFDNLSKHNKIVWKCPSVNYNTECHVILYTLMHEDNILV